MTNDGDAVPAPSPATTITKPIVVDLGKQRRKAIAQLKGGEGPLPAEVADTVQHLVDELGDEAHGKIVIPVVVVYRKRRKRKRTGLARLWP
jgi:hypothetical protein